MSDFKSLLGKIVVQNSKVISVEKGNVLRKDIPVDKKVCAFSVNVEGSCVPVKALLKGRLAEIVYEAISGGTTMDQVQDVNGFKITLNTLISFSGDIREVRLKEFVLHNIENIKFVQTTIIGETDGESTKD